MVSSDYLHAPFLGAADYLEALRLLEPKSPPPPAPRRPPPRLSARDQALRGQETAVVAAMWTDRGFADASVTCGFRWASRVRTRASLSSASALG